MKPLSSLPSKLLRLHTSPFKCLYEPARRRLLLRSQKNDSLLPWSRLYTITPGSGRSFGSVEKRKSSRNRPALPLYSQWFQSVRRGYKTVEEARSRYKMGPFSIISVVIFVGTGIGMSFYFRYEKERMERKRIADATKGMGKPKVGGPFELVDQDGRTWNSKSEMTGKFSLVYFGFSHCPDICPEELDKMANMLDLVSKKLPSSSPKNPDLLPIFITCDPARDTPAVLKTYLKEFHPDFIGLTGAWEQIKAVCKLYRVYFSTPPGVKPGMDYLVDHSIYFYLMDPEGDFVEAIGRQHTAEQAAKIISEHMADWKGNVVKS